MSLKLYNSLTRRKEPFETLEPGKVKMYCCGVTVYDYCHLGHARSYIVWDTVRRYLQWRGYAVRYVQNFTDIDDKILKRARQEESSMEAVAERYTATYFEDMKRLNVLEADEYPRATCTLDGIKQLIAELEAKGFAYPAAGDVYYSVRQFEDYGKLSGRELERMQAGASGRMGQGGDSGSGTGGPGSSGSGSGGSGATEVAAVDGVPQKRDPFDFALWKRAKPGEPAWESPWGAGRPGWHIECSAMVRERLGSSIDIHMGGNDLVFPHHENEIAQSEAVTGQPLARYWLHNGMVNVGGEKMSKSLGNFTTIRQLLDAPEGPDPMALRLFVLQAQYRKPLDFTPDAIAAAKNSWQTLKGGLLFGHQFAEQLNWRDPEDVQLAEENETVQQFQTAMDDDFNAAGGLAVLFELAKDLRRVGNVLVHQGTVERDAEELRQQWQTLVALSQVLGLELAAADKRAATETSSDAAGTGLDDAGIEALVQQRQAARKAKNFAEADRIRDVLNAQKIVLIDQPGGETRWRRH